MNFGIMLLSKTGGQLRDARRVAEEFRQSVRLYVRSTEINTIAVDRSPQEIYAINVELNDVLIAPEHFDDLTDAFWDRLAAMGLAHGLLPVDVDGNLIYLRPPYFLSMAFHSREPGRRGDLEEILHKVRCEAPDHVEGLDIESHVSKEMGEFIIVRLMLNDYLPDSERDIIRLGFYFRILRLTRERGFQALDLRMPGGK